MTPQQIKRIVTQNVMIGALIMITPTIVMVILDLFDKHTPNKICMISLIVMTPMVAFQSMRLRKLLGAFTESGAEK